MPRDYSPPHYAKIGPEALTIPMPPLYRLVWLDLLVLTRRGPVAASMEGRGERLGLASRTLRRAEQWLVDRDFLAIERVPGKPNRYRAGLPGPRTPEAGVRHPNPGLWRQGLDTLTPDSGARGPRTLAPGVRARDPLTDLETKTHTTRVCARAREGQDDPLLILAGYLGRDPLGREPSELAELLAAYPQLTTPQLEAAAVEARGWCAAHGGGNPKSLTPLRNAVADLVNPVARNGTARAAKAARSVTGGQLCRACRQTWVPRGGRCPCRAEKERHAE